MGDASPLLDKISLMGHNMITRDGAQDSDTFHKRVEVLKFEVLGLGCRLVKYLSSDVFKS